MAMLGYARVSTGDQSLDAQRDALIAAGVEERCIYTEVMSGSKAQRPGLEGALKALQRGDVLVVTRLDRLGRSMNDLIQLVGRIKEIGADFRSLTEAMDTSTPGGRLIFHVFGAVAEFERDIIRERTRVSLAAARARGKKGGRKPSLGEAQLKRARAMLADPEITVEEVAEQLGVSPATLYRHLPGGRSSLET